LWAAYVFLLLLHFWWWEYKFHDLHVWTFGTYFFIICYILVFYLLCALLFPDNMKDYKDFEDYYYSRKNWFFAVLALSFVMDVADTLLKGKQYASGLQNIYPVRNGIHALLCLVAIWVSNRVFHAFLVIAFLLFEIYFILNFYDVA
jgi:hypothetical protein